MGKLLKRTALVLAGMASFIVLPAQEGQEIITPKPYVTDSQQELDKELLLRKVPNWDLFPQRPRPLPVPKPWVIDPIPDKPGTEKRIILPHIPKKS